MKFIILILVLLLLQYINTVEYCNINQVCGWSVIDTNKTIFKNEFITDKYNETRLHLVPYYTFKYHKKANCICIYKCVRNNLLVYDQFIYRCKSFF